MSSELLDVIHDKDLRVTCRLIGAHMILCPQPQTAVEVSNTTGLNRRTVTNSLNELLRTGVVRRDRHGLWLREPAESIGGGK